MSTIYSAKNHQPVMFAPLALKCMSQANVEMVLLTLKKGEFIPIHKNPFEVLFYVKSGVGVLTVDQTEHVLGENDMASVANSENRSWENQEEQDLVLLVIKLFK